jgi:hypothetical protein
VNFDAVFDPTGVPSTERTFPLTLVVYVTPPSSEADGVSVAVNVAASYVTDAGTMVPSAAKSWNVVVEMDDAAIERENVALTAVARST